MRYAKNTPHSAVVAVVWFSASPDRIVRLFVRSHFRETKSQSAGEHHRREGFSLRLALNHGTLTFEQLSLTNLLLQAYDIQRNQIVGCPGWCDAEFFDVVGKAGSVIIDEENSHKKPPKCFH